MFFAVNSELRIKLISAMSGWQSTQTMGKLVAYERSADEYDRLSCPIERSSRLVERSSVEYDRITGWIERLDRNYERFSILPTRKTPAKSASSFQT